MSDKNLSKEWEDLKLQGKYWREAKKKMTDHKEKGKEDT